LDKKGRIEIIAESQIQELKSIILQDASYIDADIKKEAPESGFEPESEPQQGLTGTSRPLALQSLSGSEAP
jgi:hypothetical protein